MKKLVLFSLIVGLMVTFGACNNPAGEDPGGGGDGDVTDVIFVWGTMDEMTGEVTPGTTDLDLTEDSGNYPGRELILADCTNIYGPQNADGRYTKDYVLGDISDYGEIILTAILYNKDGEEVKTGTSLAQFSILKEGSSGWEDDNKLAEKYNLSSNTPTMATPTSGKTGMAGKLLVQGSYEQSAKTDASVTKVKVVSLEFKLRTGKPIFTVQYGDAVTVTSGNQIHFNNAKYGDGAVLFQFPSDWPQDNALSGKKMVFEYTISGITGPDPSNAQNIQINLQAAQKEGDKVNDQHDGSGEAGQKYIMLDDPEDGDSVKYNLTWTPTGGTTPSNGSGSFKIPFSGLLTAAQAGSFTLDSIRIENNGDIYQGNQKQKTYTLIFNSITVE